MKDRVIGYDLMRIIAAVMVVAIHSNVYFLNRAENDVEWIAVMLMTATCVMSVPLFFMVSGAGNLVKEKTTTVKQLFSEKIPKVFLPFLIWSFIYVGARMGMGKIDVGYEAFLSLLWEPAYYQFWFMYSLLGMYLCIPLFQYVIMNADKKLLQYIIFFWIVSSSILPVMERYVPWFKLSGHFNLLFLEGYWGYFFIGGYLRKYPLDNPRKKGLLMFATGLVVTFFCSLIEWYLVPAEKYYGFVYSSYLLPGAVLMSIGAFSYLQEAKIASSTKDRVIYFSGLTMGVYYIHCLLINAYEMVFKNIAPTALNSLCKVVVLIVVAVFICSILKKVKFLNKYLL